ncbi:hypothetical protein E2C01_020088 [Portunus trituberculatus]|uniref:Uncharacterized protein n=1 Tax=Portunus trituberculatus TaxID=210409 RepID=A0A5B7E272_PORTR|nr:hypothetical protein [Portunus trituberculatus]
MAETETSHYRSAHFLRLLGRGRRPGGRGVAAPLVLSSIVLARLQVMVVARIMAAGRTHPCHYRDPCQPSGRPLPLARYTGRPPEHAPRFAFSCFVCGRLIHSFTITPSIMASLALARLPIHHQLSIHAPGRTHMPDRKMLSGKDPRWPSGDKREEPRRECSWRYIAVIPSAFPEALLYTALFALVPECDSLR